MNEPVTAKDAMARLERWSKTLEANADGRAQLVFGLRQQGHYARVRRMRLERMTWDEIGTAIGWTGEAVEQLYEIETRVYIQQFAAWLDEQRSVAVASAKKRRSGFSDKAKLYEAIAAKLAEMQLV